ncbi:diaminopimelate epimerase [Halobacteriaceae archaeon GCM10025711]
MIPYQKYHGTGNDFVIVDASNRVPDRSAFAMDVCDRETGVGADGVLFLHLEAQFNPPRVVFTLFQPDGSTAAMCGNGARCAARWAADRVPVDEDEDPDAPRAFMLDTQAGTRRTVVEGDEVAVEMGAPAFRPLDVPVDAFGAFEDEELGGYEVTAVNTGVPHAVAFVDDVDEVDVEADAPAIRHADVFPEGANVTFASRREDGGFDQRTFERGVEGETRSCGTGAVAIAAVAERKGLVDPGEAVSVTPPGGELVVAVDENGMATLRGPVEYEFDGEVEAPPVRILDA